MDNAGNDDPPLAGIALAESHYTTELIQKTKEFVINVPSENLLQAVMQCGSVSGRKEDKFKKAKTIHLLGGGVFYDKRKEDKDIRANFSSLVL